MDTRGGKGLIEGRWLERIVNLEGVTSVGGATRAEIRNLLRGSRGRSHVQSTEMSRRRCCNRRRPPADFESRPTVADRWHIAVTTPGGRLSWLMRFDPRSGGRLVWARPGSLATSLGRERASGLDLQIRPSRRPSATASNLE
jgi:hypothetical protein